MAQSRSFLIILLLVAGCAAPKPILYPNAHSQQVGKEVADRDIDECREMAKDAGATASQGKSVQVAGSTLVTAVVPVAAQLSRSSPKPSSDSNCSSKRAMRGPASRASVSAPST